MGLFDKFVNVEKKTQEIISKQMEKYVTASVQDLDLDLIPIKEQMNKYKGVVIFPEALDYYPIDRPQNILRTFAKNGYLCFFCVDKTYEHSIKQVEPNLFIIRNQERLLPLLKNQKVLILITYFLQYTFAKMFDNRIIWFDIMGKIDKYKYYSNYSIQIYKEIMKEAFIATYRKDEFKIYYENVRENIILMKDGIMLEDFINEKNIIGEDIKKCLHLNKKVLGYYGNIDNSIDFELIKRLDSTNKYAIVLIGNLHDTIELKEYSLHNTFILPKKDYLELKYYVPNFDIVIFPLKNDENNNLHNKVLECTAMYKKIITYKYKSISDLDFPNLFFVRNNDELINLIDEKIKEKDYEYNKKIDYALNNYKWENTINKLL